MVDNGIESLRCGVAAHGPMERRLSDRQPYAGPFSVWACLSCGTLALHLEWCGDIYWYGASASKDMWRTGPGDQRWTAEWEAQPSHQATCDFHTTEFVFTCPCINPEGPHMCGRCDTAAKDSKMAPPELIAPDPGEVAAEQAQAEAYEGEDLPW